MRLSQLRIVSGVWDVNHTYIPIEDIVVFLTVRSHMQHGVDNMKAAFNLEHKYRVTMLNREDWAKGTGAPPAVKGLNWFRDGSKMRGRGRGLSLLAIFGKKAQLFPG